MYIHGLRGRLWKIGKNQMGPKFCPEITLVIWLGWEGKKHPRENLENKLSLLLIHFSTWFWHPGDSFICLQTQKVAPKIPVIYYIASSAPMSVLLTQPASGTVFTTHPAKNPDNQPPSPAHLPPKPLVLSAISLMILFLLHASPDLNTCKVSLSSSIGSKPQFLGAGM